MNAFQPAPFLLCGEDYEGDTREIGCLTIGTARLLAQTLTTPEDEDGPPWQSFEIWGNDPVTEEWRALESS